MMQVGTVCDASMVTELLPLFAAVTANMMEMRKYVERANNNKDDMLEVARRTYKLVGVDPGIGISGSLGNGTS